MLDSSSSHLLLPQTSVNVNIVFFLIRKQTQTFSFFFLTAKRPLQSTIVLILFKLIAVYNDPNGHSAQAG